MVRKQGNQDTDKLSKTSKMRPEMILVQTKCVFGGAIHLQEEGPGDQQPTKTGALCADVQKDQNDFWY